MGKNMHLKYLACKIPLVINFFQDNISVVVVLKKSIADSFAFGTRLLKCLPNTVSSLSHHSICASSLVPPCSVD